MRFKRRDLPGIALAGLAPVGLFVLFLASYDVWDHRGTPLLGFMASNLAIALGLMAAFTRYVRNWDIPAALIGALLVIIAAVIWAQQSGNDGGALATTLKLFGVLDFLLINVALGGQVFWYGLIPVLDRRSAAAAAAAAADD